MKTIETVKGVSVLVDDEDFDRVSAYRWNISGDGYAKRRSKSKGKASIVMMHRFILGMDSKDLRIVDHANRVKTDNRKCNLRICTKSENGCNQGPQKNNTTGYKGVTIHKDTGRFMAQIRKDGKKLYLGLFDTAEEAAHSYNKAAVLHHGDFSALNPVGKAKE